MVLLFDNMRSGSLLALFSAKKKRAGIKNEYDGNSPNWELTDKRSTAVNFVLKRSVIHALKFYNSKEPKRT
jgi:hypothetical protein